MIYLMALIILGLLTLSYNMTGKDILAPSNVMLFTFLVSVCSSILNIGTWKFDIGFYSAFLIISSLLMTLVINSAFHKMYSKKSITVEKIQLYEIRLPVLIIFIVYLAFCIYKQYMVVRSIGGGSLSTMLYIYRLSSSYGTGSVDVTGISSNLVDIASGITYISLFNLIYFFKKSSLLYRIVNCTIFVLWVLLFFLQGARFEVFSAFIFVFVVCYFIKIMKTQKFKKYNLKQIYKIFIISFALLYFFYLLKDFVGRSSSKTIVEYLTSYLGGSIPLFDLFIKDPPTEIHIFGQETFYSLIEGLKRRGLIDFPLVSFHKEFRSSNGIGLGNAYTALRDYYYDFGIVGMYIMHSIFSVIFSWFYEKTKVRVSCKRIIFLALIYNCVFFYMFNNTFFSSYCSKSFFLILILVYILFELLMERKVFRKKIRVN